MPQNSLSHWQLERLTRRKREKRTKTKEQKKRKKRTTWRPSLLLYGLLRHRDSNGAIGRYEFGVMVGTIAERKGVSRTWPKGGCERGCKKTSREEVATRRNVSVLCLNKGTGRQTDRNRRSTKKAYEYERNSQRTVRKRTSSIQSEKQEGIDLT